MAETDRTEGGPFEVGILSDTHGLLRPSVFHALEGVDHILHAGDVGNPDILTALEALAPVTAVWGNTDGFDLRHRVPEVARVGLAGLSVVVLHGHRFGRTPTPEVLREAYPEAGLVVYGHTHRPVMEELGGAWFVNPGSCGPRRFQLPVGLARGVVEAGRFRGRWMELES
jgi:uncharacterized protein